jgi:hypothetical protein
VFSRAVLVVSLEVLETVHPQHLLLLNGAIALHQVPKPHLQPRMHASHMFVGTAVPTGFELFINVIWVKILDHLPL